MIRYAAKRFLERAISLNWLADMFAKQFDFEVIVACITHARSAS